VTTRDVGWETAAAVAALEQLASAARELAGTLQDPHPAVPHPPAVARRMQALDLAQKSMAQALGRWVEANPEIARQIL
jgi:hypothetical protein